MFGFCNNVQICGKKFREDHDTGPQGAGPKVVCALTSILAMVSFKRGCHSDPDHPRLSHIQIDKASCQGSKQNVTPSE